MLTGTSGHEYRSLHLSLLGAFEAFAQLFPFKLFGIIGREMCSPNETVNVSAVTGLGSEFLRE
jgi:hypothetical protein